MFGLKKIAGCALVAAAMATSAVAEDAFFCPRDFFFRECARMMEDFPQISFPGACRMTGIRESISVKECDKGYQIKLMTPGVAKENYEISVAGDLLKIVIKKQDESKKQDEKGEKVQTECCGMFSQAYRLPANADKANIKASYKDGVMTICIPKMKEEPQTERKITIE